MGGSSGSSAGRRGKPRVSGTAGQPKGMGGGGAGGPGGLECPLKISAVVTGPAPGITAGSWLEVQLDTSTDPPRVTLLDPAAGVTVGSISGIPGLNILIQCLNGGVSYRAYVDKVDGGRVDVTLVRQ